MSFVYLHNSFSNFQLKYIEPCKENTTKCSTLTVKKLYDSVSDLNISEKYPRAESPTIRSSVNNLCGVLIKINDKTCFLTCYRYIEKKENIKFENDYYGNIKIYKIIKELDLVLIDMSTVTTQKAVNVHHNITNGKQISIVLNDNGILLFDNFEIILDHINTTSIPKIPQIKIKNICQSCDKTLCGGNIVLQNNEPVAIVSYTDDTYIYCIPFNIITYLFESKLYFDKHCIAQIVNYLIPTDISKIKEDIEDINCQIVNKTTEIVYKTINSYTRFNDNDVIININGLNFESDGTIYFKQFNTFIYFDTYLFLMACYELNVCISYYKYDAIKMEHENDVKICTLTTPIIQKNYTILNTYDDQENIKIFCASFNELSEEYLIRMLKNGIKFTEEHYKNTILPFSDKKIVFLNKVEYNNITKDSLTLAKYLDKINAPFVESDGGKYKLLILYSINSIIINNIEELKNILLREKIITKISLKYLDSDGIFRF